MMLPTRFAEKSTLSVSIRSLSLVYVILHMINTTLTYILLNLHAGNDYAA